MLTFQFWNLEQLSNFDSDRTDVVDFFQQITLQLGTLLGGGAQIYCTKNFKLAVAFGPEFASYINYMNL
jgi:hypothetical protein